MLETSKDILNLVIAFAILWITVFICWFIYYIIAVIKRVHDTIDFFHKTLVSLNEMISNVKDKLKSSSTHFKLIGMLVKKVIQEIDNRKTRRANKNTKAKTKSKTKKK